MVPLTTNETDLVNPSLQGRTLFLDGGEVGVLLLHGFTATTFEVQSLAHFINQNGYTVCAPLLPGHGTTPTDLNFCQWQDWATEAEVQFTNLQTKTSEQFVGGESLGGLLSLYLSIKHSEIKGVLLYAPALITQNIWLAGFLSLFTKVRKKKNGDNLLPWQGYQVYPLKASNQMYQLQKLIKKQLGLIHQPTLIFQGGQDHTIDPGGARMIFNRISSIEKEMIWLKDTRHCILLEPGYENVYEASLRFIDKLTQTEKNDASDQEQASE